MDETAGEITELEVTVSKKIPIEGVDYSSQSASARVVKHMGAGGSGKTLGDEYNRLFDIAERAVNKRLRAMQSRSSG